MNATRLDNAASHSTPYRHGHIKPEVGRAEEDLDQNPGHFIDGDLVPGQHALRSVSMDGAQGHVPNQIAKDRACSELTNVVKKPALDQPGNTLVETRTTLTEVEDNDDRQEFAECFGLIDRLDKASSIYDLLTISFSTGISSG